LLLLFVVCSKTMNITDDQLCDLLIKAGKLDKKTFAELKKQAAQNQQPLRTMLVSSEIATDEDLGLLEANFLKVPFVVLTKASIPADVLNIIPEDVAKKQKAIVFERSKDGIKIAVSDLQNRAILEMVAKKTGEKVMAYYATQNDIDNTITLYRKDLQKKFQKLLEEGLGTSSIAARNYDPPIEKIVHLLLNSAYQDKASDIHIEPKEDDSLVRFRVDGVLYDSLKVPTKLHDRIVTRIKVLSSLRTDEHMSAQDGKMQVSLKEENLDLRVSILPVADGEKVVLRLLSSKSRAHSLTDLGMNERDLMKLTAGFNKPNGMVLSTGPTGSGKTTSIYSIIKILNVRDKNITTIEDPVEYKIQGANQVQVNTKTNLTFANGLRSILRQDPDYIFVGEIRDNETAAIAVNAALTGHLVLSTLHTNDAPAAIPRLIDMKVEPFLVASTLNVVFAQRLLRKICNQCRVSFTMSQDELLKHFSSDMISKHYEPVGKNKEVRLYRGDGCEHCHFTGYDGRVGIFEVLEVTQPIRELIVEKRDADEIGRKAREEGMTTLLDDGLDKITRGMTTIEEVIRVTKVDN
jgi:type IV pilus assembly protein PilB